MGTVYEKNKSKITVGFQKRLPDWVETESSFHLSISANRTTYQRMFKTLEDVQQGQHSRAAQLRDLSLGLRKAEWGSAEKLTFFNQALNENQKQAVSRAFESQDFLIIHGPPGTGKTSVLVELIQQISKRKESVLVTAPSNAACDHLLACLVNVGLHPVRMGHPARMNRAFREHTFSYQLMNHRYGKLISDNEARIDQMDRQKNRREERRVMDYGERREFREEFRRLREENKILKAEIMKDVWNQADIMIATLVGSGDRLVQSKPFDWVIIDEATQGLEPETWIPIQSAAKRVVLAGDHQQLSPTLFSEEAIKGGLGKSLFERLHENLQEDAKVLLTTQYRMHEKIMKFPSQKFYQDQLIADDSVASASFDEAPTTTPSAGEPFVFVDTAGLGYEEQSDPGTSSRFNEEEAKVLIKLLNEILSAGVEASSIGVISPYRAQVKLLDSLMDQPGLEIDSIDSFQGRGKRGDFGFACSF